MATFESIKHFRTHNAAIFNNHSRTFVIDEQSLIERITNLRKLNIDVSEELKALKALKEDK